MTGLQLLIVLLCTSVNGPANLKRMCDASMQKCVASEIKSKRLKHESDAVMRCSKLYISPYTGKDI
jgi:hypothetical protein